MRASLDGQAGNYPEFSDGTAEFTADQLESSFVSEGGVNFLVLTKVVGGTDCLEIEVDGVKVCKEVAEQITLKCMYSLADVDLSDDFSVSGQDTLATAENTGTLGYSLEVNDADIGDPVTFTVIPKNPGLVYATIKSCDVKKGTDEITIVGHNAESCTNAVVNVKDITDNLTSKDNIQGQLKSFKWSTSGASVEAQTLTCTIGLTENESSVEVEDCPKAAPKPCVDKKSECWKDIWFTQHYTDYACKHVAKIRDNCDKTCGFC